MVPLLDTEATFTLSDQSSKRYMEPFTMANALTATGDVTVLPSEGEHMTMPFVVGAWHCGGGAAPGSCKSQAPRPKVPARRIRVERSIAREVTIAFGMFPAM